MFKFGISNVLDFFEKNDLCSKFANDIQNKMQPRKHQDIIFELWWSQGHQKPTQQ